MAKAVGKVVIDIERCKGCQLCIVACPEKVLTLSDGINMRGYQYSVQSGTTCTGCSSCALVCPDAVITVYRKIIK